MNENLKNYFEQLTKQGFLKQEEIGLDQIKALLVSAKKNLMAANKTLEIDEETCYTMAYSCVLKLGRALIFLHGFRPDDGQQHKTTIEAAFFILGDDYKNLFFVFDKMRQKRNQFTYDPLFPLSIAEVKEALKNADNFLSEVRNFIKTKNPQLSLF